MKFQNNSIELNKEINELDKLVFKFVKIIENYTDYVIIRGYVSILLGRSRSTEDVDLFIHKIDKLKFKEFYDELKKNGFWCLNAEDVNEIINYLNDGVAVRFAEEGKVIPNFEVKYPKKQLDLESFDNRITVVTKIGKLLISSIERQIAFKRYYLKSEKDMEDAMYIEKLFPGKINNEIIQKYKKSIQLYLKNEET